jgi:putative DNA primase/helicase
MHMIRAAELADCIGAGWPELLERLGIGREFLSNKHGPCPACGGTDRYRFDNKRGHGNFFCNGCGAGDGFALLMRTFQWDFRTALARVAEAAGLRDTRTVAQPRSVPMQTPAHDVARPPARVTRLWRESCAIADCDEVVEYLEFRHLWPIPEECTLRAHPSLEYFDHGRRVGRYASLLAPVRDVAGDLVTMHVTYLHQGRKLKAREPRKILSPLQGRTGSAVRLAPLAGDVLGIGEGIETCLAATHLHDIPTWAALNTSLLAKFTPPAAVKRLVIFADADVPGLTAAAALMQRLQGQVELEIRTPRAAKDWNDVLRETSA